MSGDKYIIHAHPFGASMKLTKRSAEDADVGRVKALVWDDEIKGFGLRVYPSGKKTNALSNPATWWGECKTSFFNAFFDSNLSANIAYDIRRIAMPKVSGCPKILSLRCVTYSTTST
ncbi:hypothetical protein [Pseudosulfitobacter sp. SM2401]|uniref:hypothetical protein n=1 Tax=Pseudosulfitobacter sp. SM2401 TaxID=3350098 RepID=UPI0036F1FB9F